MPEYQVRAWYLNVNKCHATAHILLNKAGDEEVDLVFIGEADYREKIVGGGRVGRNTHGKYDLVMDARGEGKIAAY